MKFLGFGLIGTGVLFMVAAYRNESPLAVIQNRTKAPAFVPGAPGTSLFNEQVPKFQP